MGEIPGTTNTAPPTGRCVWRAIIVGMVVSLPFAWILSFAGFHFLGLFFFALAGLLIGAAAFRAAKAARPLPRRWTRTITVVLVLFCWASTVLFESRAIPVMAARQAADSLRVLPEGTKIDAFLAEREEEVRQTLREIAWPGGMLGYVRWVVSSGEMELSGGLMNPMRFRAPQARWIWCGRAVLSFLLLAFGIHSQVKTLGPPRVVPDDTTENEADPERPMDAALETSRRPAVESG